ncbi:hypothetical protein SAMN05216225_101736 [Ornithinibacillus halophilus]|uniref:Uncharacterized protein n=1 Tax=Ornithinibacillus halophilus TaxID=930117 RepID=A0A1M5HFI7_9BACI|nr:hypothetical protein SAMN05216225_101736 [Ornithinibacillus halophilus]
MEIATLIISGISIGISISTLAIVFFDKKSTESRLILISFKFNILKHQKSHRSLHSMTFLFT